MRTSHSQHSTVPSTAQWQGRRSADSGYEAQSIHGGALES